MKLAESSAERAVGRLLTADASIPYVLSALQPGKKHVCFAGWLAGKAETLHAPVDGVVLPPAALLHAKRSPLVLGQKARLRQHFGRLLGQHHVPGQAAAVGSITTTFDIY